MLIPITHKDQEQSKASQNSNISPNKQRMSKMISQELGIKQ